MYQNSSLFPRIIAYNKRLTRLVSYVSASRNIPMFIPAPFPDNTSLRPPLAIHNLMQFGETESQTV